MSRCTARVRDAWYVQNARLHTATAEKRIVACNPAPACRDGVSLPVIEPQHEASSIQSRSVHGLLNELHQAPTPGPFPPGLFTLFVALMHNGARQ